MSIAGFQMLQKKTNSVWVSDRTEFNSFELDELFLFIGKKEVTKTRENAYIITMISRKPRQIVRYYAGNTREQNAMQCMIDSMGKAETYNTDGYTGYIFLDYHGGHHNRNINDKKDTHIVESINADLRCYIPGLKRRSRCFYRKIETIEQVLTVFVDAYNKFGEEKLK